MSFPYHLAIAIVPGSFSPFAYYVSTIAKLHAAGVEAVQFISYPSIGRKDAAPAATMIDDAVYIHSELEKLADSGYDILVNAHSYGGVPASESLKDLSKKQRNQEGKQGGVIGIIYTAALTPPVGKSLSDVMGAGEDPGQSAPTPYVRIEGDYMSLEPTQNAKLNFSGMPYDEGVKWAERMPEHSTASFAGKLSYAGYKDVNVTYLSTTKDLTVSIEVQQEQIGNMRGAGSQVDVVEIPTDHFPYLSATDEVVGAILKVARL